MDKVLILFIFMFYVGISVGAGVAGDRLREDVKLIVERLRGKRVLIDDMFEVDFVDREREARYILEGVARIRASRGVVVLYGPKGCGKSRFFDVLTEAIREANEGSGTNIEVIYVRWDEAEKVVKAVSSGLLENIKDEIMSREAEIAFDGEVAISSKLDLFKFFARIISIIDTSRKAREQGRILFVMDERSVKTQVDAEEFKSELDSLADNMSRAILKYYQEKRGYMTAAILSSDALVAETWQRIGTKVGWLLMWNLPRGDFERLADQLGISVERDLLWNLTGGNPRALGDILESGLEGWLASFVGNKVVDALMPYWKLDPEQTMRAVREIVENPDELGAWRKPLSPPLGDIFLEGNIAIRIVGLPGPITELPKEPWIGKMYSYQLPAYYYTLKTIARKGDLKITPEDVIREAKGISDTGKRREREKGPQSA